MFEVLPFLVALPYIADSCTKPTWRVSIVVILKPLGIPLGTYMDTPKTGNHVRYVGDFQRDTNMLE